MKISAAQRHDNENRIRTVIDRLLRGDIPPGGRCDVKTLAREADVDRAAFYGSRPYAHLRAEFETRLASLREAGGTPDPRDARVARLEAALAAAEERLARANATVAELTDFRTRALARLAAQHDEITRLREAAASRVTRLPNRAGVIGACS
jgi:hypothetical protein